MQGEWRFFLNCLFLQNLCPRRQVFCDPKMRSRIAKHHSRLSVNLIAWEVRLGTPVCICNDLSKRCSGLTWKKKKKASKLVNCCIEKLYLKLSPNYTLFTLQMVTQSLAEPGVSGLFLLPWAKQKAGPHKTCLKPSSLVLRLREL